MCFVFALALAALHALANTPIPLTNPSFETPYVAVNGVPAGVTGVQANGWSANTYGIRSRGPILAGD